MLPDRLPRQVARGGELEIGLEHLGWSRMRFRAFGALVREVGTVELGATLPVERDARLARGGCFAAVGGGGRRLGLEAGGGAIMKLAFSSALQPASSHWSLAEGKTEWQSFASPLTPSPQEGEEGPDATNAPERPIPTTGEQSTFFMGFVGVQESVGIQLQANVELSNEVLDGRGSTQFG